jgi:hypothetical protein
VAQVVVRQENVHRVGGGLLDEKPADPPQEGPLTITVTLERTHVVHTGRDRRAVRVDRLPPRALRCDAKSWPGSRGGSF